MGRRTSSKNRSNLQSKLVRVFVIQVALISAVTVAGIYAAKVMLEDVLVREALKGEAAHYWQRREQNPDAAMPDTLNLLGYLAPVDRPASSNVPSAIAALPPGLHRARIDGKEPIIYIEDRGSQRLFLIFDEDSVSHLALLFGVVPLAAVLIVLYLLAWLAYRQSRKAVSPVVHLASVVEAMDFRDGHWHQLDAAAAEFAGNVEVDSLVSALNHFIARLEAFVERERHFTRDASHELRTPIAVLRSALEVIERKYGGEGDKTIARMNRTLKDMEALIETLLLLARDESERLTETVVSLNRLVEEDIEALKLIHRGKPLDVVVEERSPLQVLAPEKVVSILVGNLLRNAFNYTPEGTIKVIIGDQWLEVSDSGVGMSHQQLEAVTEPFYRGGQLADSPGHGLGMAIVKRLCQRYRWRLSVTSSIGEGTQVRIHFGTES
ncbi:MAG: sensor histidine kinase [Pseudomonadota bacterium]